MIPRQHKILIIDEVNYTRLVLDLNLANAGYKVATARNSGETMQRISAELPDIILLSLRASDTSGVSTRRVLKDYFRLRMDIAQGAEPPIIVLSPFRDTKQIREVQGMGASKIIFKPINMQELLESIESIITNKKKVIPQTRKKIIILDNESRSRQFLESILVHEMYDIEAAESETELLERIKHRKFDLAIIDLASIDSETAKVMGRIKEIAEEMPIITIATSADGEDELEQLGMQIRFVKPLNVGVFRTQVDTLMKPSDSFQGEVFSQSDNETPQAEMPISEEEPPS